MAVVGLQAFVEVADAGGIRLVSATSSGEETDQPPAVRQWG
jgi:hypothetical protein